MSRAASSGRASSGRASSGRASSGSRAAGSAASRLDVAAALVGLRAALARRGTPERAAGARRYLKSELEFLGATVPVIRAEGVAFVRAHPALSRRQLRALSEASFDTGVHELRSVAIAILECARDVLTEPDARWLIGLVRRCDTWAHVDWLAVKVLGPLVARHPALGVAQSRWAKDESFWVRRSALLALHDPLLQGRGDFERFERLAAPLLGEREFFIRKAIGWVLRSTAKRRPELTRGFVERHAGRMSALTFKEATRLLAPADQRRLRRLRVQLEAH